MQLRFNFSLFFSYRAIAVGTSQAAMSIGSIAGSYLIWLVSEQTTFV